MNAPLDEKKTKELFKEAMLELFEERKDLIYEIFAEAIEDIVLVNAIREEESADSVSKEEIFNILEGED